MDLAAGSNETLPLEQLHEGSPWLVDNPQKELLTIMTPVFPDPHTLSFLKNQVCSWIKSSAGSCLYHRVSVVLRLCSLCCGQSSHTKRLLQLRSANNHLDMSSVKEWLFIAPEHQIARLIDFLEVQIGLLPCVPAAKARPSVLQILTAAATENACGHRPTPQQMCLMIELIQLVCGCT